MPLFSVIIPVNNRPELLVRAVESVARQTFLDWECHIIDDGSVTPHTYYQKHQNLSGENRDKIYYHYFPKNRGVSWARNQGFIFSHGEWITFLDSDDEWLPNKLSAMEKYIKIHSNTKIFQSEEIWVRGGKRINPPTHLLKPEGYIFTESLKRCLITVSSVVIHRSLLEKESWDESLPVCEDYDLWLRLTLCHRVGLIPQSLAIRYQDYGGEQLSKQYPVMDKYRLRSLKKLIQKLIQENGDTKNIKLSIQTMEEKTKIILNGAVKRRNIGLFVKIFFKYYLWGRLLT